MPLALSRGADLFPYDPIVFTYLHYPNNCSRHLCGLYSVPYYTWHKVMAGLLDHATHAQSGLAWQMVLRMADWVERHAGAAGHRRCVRIQAPFSY